MFVLTCSVLLSVFFFLFRIFGLQFMDEIQKIEAHDSEVLCLAFSPAETGNIFLSVYRKHEPELNGKCFSFKVESFQQNQHNLYIFGQTNLHAMKCVFSMTSNVQIGLLANPVVT